MSFYILCQIICSSSALAAILFGGELTFTNEAIKEEGFKRRAIVNTEAAIDAQKKMLKEFTKKCLANNSCKVVKTKNKYGAEIYKVIFPKKNGFWLQISTDPSVIEVQTKPSTAKEFKQMRPILDNLFQSGEKAGIRPDYYGMAGGGHIHLDFESTFKGDANLFRNFMVDFANHQELGGQGILDSDLNNAPHIFNLSKQQKTEFKKVIQEFDEGKIKSIQALAKEINNRVYTKHPNNWKPVKKFNAINLTRADLPPGQSTLEIRSLSPQRDPDDFYRLLDLFESRVEYLRGLKGKIKIQDLNKELNSTEKIAAFRSYVVESKLDWDSYKKMARANPDLLQSNTTPISRVELQKPDKESESTSASLDCQKEFKKLKKSAPRKSR